MLGGLGAALSVELAASERLPAHAAATSATAATMRLLLGDRDIVGSWRVEGGLGSIARVTTKVRRPSSETKGGDVWPSLHDFALARGERLARGVPVGERPCRATKAICHSGLRCCT